MIIKTIKQENQSLVVEWTDEDGIHRGIVPNEMVVKGAVNDSLRSLIIPYGTDWEMILEMLINTVTPEMVANNLRKRGIWTVDDLRSKPKSALAAFQDSYGLELSSLLRAVKNGGYK